MTYLEVLQDRTLFERAMSLVTWAAPYGHCLITVCTSGRDVSCVAYESTRSCSHFRIVAHLASFGPESERLYVRLLLIPTMRIRQATLKDVHE